MAIDYHDAHVRIVKAFCDGLINTYGLRRTVEHKIKVVRPGALYFKKDERWVDPEGVERVGRFMRKPPVEVEATQRIPQGVVPEQVLGYANAVAGAFLEVLKICEEQGLGARVGTMTELAEEVAQRLGGKEVA